MPKAAPVLPGNRLLLSMPGPLTAAEPPTPWLARTLTVLANEADGAVLPAR
jgi:hypothetical protein